MMPKAASTHLLFSQGPAIVVRSILDLPLSPIDIFSYILFGSNLLFLTTSLLPTRALVV
jgi:hypothetical protein